ncbi:uncharacterized protein LOC106137660 [Amyelois transitella]|uniref:uncharacterized protein LOC106137660 n=1 Tax=Amyelois transitella TaxID=680683 RepID=UPI00067ACAF0|nr:uncharacterized protein LOC106137660 [Amyelois transitella]
MASLLDAEAILSCNEQWKKLDEAWGDPIDLETDEDLTPAMKTVFSTLDLRKTTFDSSFILKKVRRKVGRKLSKRSVLDYKDFIHDLEKEVPENLPAKQFYYISGQILSALSIEDICDQIDDIFKSVEKLSSATSTIRHRKKLIPEVVECSITIDDLSFDDTDDNEREKCDDDIDGYIDEAFEQLNSTLVSLNQGCDGESMTNSVTTLVKKFSAMLKNPAVVCSPRRKRQCSNRFKDLSEFWRSRVE